MALATGDEIRSEAPAPRERRFPAHLEALAAGALAIGCVVSRLINLDRYTGSYPEGIRAEQLLLMAAGFRPFADIFSDQGPWLLQALYPGYVLFGGSLVGVRAMVVLASLVGLGGIYWLLRQVGGPIAGLTGLFLLALSPIYLQFSRLSVAEVLALAPAILAVGCSVKFSHGGRAWLFASAALLACSVLLKPITLGAALPVALAIWLTGGSRWRNLVLAGLTTAGLALLGMAVVGLPEIFQQIVEFRLASRSAEGWSLARNVSRFRSELAPEGWVLFLFAAAGALVATRHKRTWPLLAWAGAAVATVLSHSPLHTKHFALVVVPLVALASLPLAELARVGGRSEPRLPVRVVRIGLMIGVALLLFSVAQVVGRDWRIVTSEDLFERDAARLWYTDAAITLQRVLRPDEYVITDHAYLAYAAQRRIPPGLVEASATRVRAGSLSDEMAIEITERNAVRAVLLWADKLEDLRRYRAWLTEHYVPVKIWAAEADTRPVLWLRADSRLEDDLTELRRGLPRPSSDGRFGSWQLTGASVEADATNACRVDRVSATLAWSATGSTDLADASVRLVLADQSARVVDDEQEPLLAGLRSPSLIWVGALALPAGPSRGSYTATAELVDRRGRSLGAPVRIGGVLAGAC